MAEPAESCVKPSKGPIAASAAEESASVQGQPKQEVVKMMARVGKPAPDFEASAFTGGGFKNLRLSDFQGKWVILCFYPGDFTFV